jgi:hypothetical protein
MMTTLNWNILKGDIRLMWVKIESQEVDGEVIKGQLSTKHLQKFLVGATPYQHSPKTSLKLSDPQNDLIIQWFDYVTSFPTTEYFGFDYETSGFPEDQDFKVMGWSIATRDYCFYVDYNGYRLQH